ncbi:myb family transcription factor EFM-like isoform X2 [Curcuma longa]|uniref:myb family transcription factor EFM-like isoform X2 n=1 Tax=Curcuma longa TaxID=136217 RepID=UPI003D9E9FF3
MGSAATEIGLDLKLFATRTAGSFLKEAAAAVDGGVTKLEESVRSLVDERKKIEVFKRELPICMFLLTEVIELLKKELERGPGERLTQSFKEFIPIRSECEEEGMDGMKLEADCKEKTHWMSSAQLWSPNSTADDKVDDDGKSVTDERNGRSDLSEEKEENVFSESKRHYFGAGFLPFKSSKEASKSTTPPPDFSLLSSAAVKSSAFSVSSTADDHSDSGSGTKRAGRVPPLTSGALLSLQLQHPQRKTRRCWSPELHRRFVLALQKLGGSQATPKQIRELMKVDGLTNDEVKSHLQKYRLHTRKAPYGSSAGTNKPAASSRDLWMHSENCTNSSTQQNTARVSVSQSGSPQSPLQLAISGGGSGTAGGDSCLEVDGKFERSFNWMPRVKFTAET